MIVSYHDPEQLLKKNLLITGNPLIIKTVIHKTVIHRMALLGLFKVVSITCRKLLALPKDEAKVKKGPG
jgi:hypothetical protein